MIHMTDHESILRLIPFQKRRLIREKEENLKQKIITLVFGAFAWIYTVIFFHNNKQFAEHEEIHIFS